MLGLYAPFHLKSHRTLLCSLQATDSGRELKQHECPQHNAEIFHLENLQLKNTSPIDKNEDQSDIFPHFGHLWEMVATSKTKQLF